MKSLTWLISVLLAALLTAASLQLPSWITVGLFITLAINILLVMFSFGYCLFNDRDALRSESFSIKKMAIEKGIYGDSITGVLKSPVDTDEPNLLNKAQKK